MDITVDYKLTGSGWSECALDVYGQPFVLAMTYHRLEKPQQARELFVRASQRIDTEWNDEEGKFVNRYNHDWLIPVIIRREAAALIPGVEVNDVPTFPVDP